MRIVAAGRDGQGARAVVAASPAAGIDIVAIGRPVRDLERPETVGAALAAARPDVIVNATTWTAVDLAETEPDRAYAVNPLGAGAVAAVAASPGVPLIHPSTDFVFDGAKATPYVETDPVDPVGVDGSTKLAGEQTAQGMVSDHAILRTAWVYASEGKNFVRTMLDLARTRAELGVVSDQIGNPTFCP